MTPPQARQQRARLAGFAVMTLNGLAFFVIGWLGMEPIMGIGGFVIGLGGGCMAWSAIRQIREFEGEGKHR